MGQGFLNNNLGLGRRGQPELDTFSYPKRHNSIVMEIHLRETILVSYSCFIFTDI